MTRNLKALGLALLAVFAMSAVAAQGAGAAEVTHEFEATNSNVTDLTGTNVGSHIFATTTVGAQIKCTTATIKGTQTGQTVDTVTVTPAYSGCSVGNPPNQLPVTVDVGCQYTFDSDTNTDAHNGGQSATVSLECGPNHEGLIRVTVFANAAHNPAICTITFGTTHPTIPGTVNQNLRGIKYTNQGTGTTDDLFVEASVHTIHYTSHGPQCAAAGVPASGTNGWYRGDTTVKGYLDPSDHLTSHHVGIKIETTTTHP